MIEVADILRLHGGAYRQQHPLLASQQKVLEDLVRCRTAACGGQLYRCDHCGQEHYSYHSCGNRHCPKCHAQQTERWLEKQRARLLPCAYYLLTFTVPEALRGLCAGQQKALIFLRKGVQGLGEVCWFILIFVKQDFRVNRSVWCLDSGALPQTPPHPHLLGAVG